MKRLRTLSCYGDLLRRRPWPTLAVAILSIVSNVLEGLALVVLIPLISSAAGGVLDGGSKPGDLVVSALRTVGIAPTLVAVIVVFAVLATLSSVSVFLTTTVSKKLMNDAEALLRSEMFDDLLGMRWAGLSKVSLGQVNKILLQGAQFAAYGCYYLMFAFTNAAAAATYLLFSVLLSPRMTLMTVAFGVLVTPLFINLSRRGKRSSVRASNAFERFSGHLLDAMGNAKFVLAQHLSPFLGDRFHHDVDDYRVNRNRNDRQAATMRMGFELVAVAFVAIYLYVSLEVLNQSVAVALVFLAIFYRLGPRVLNAQENLFRAVSHATWLDDCLALSATAQAELAPETGVEPARFDHSLRLEQVTFRYDGATRPVLEGVDLEIRARECVAVVGPSGQGKSTLLDLISGLQQPVAGRVTLDGIPFTDIDLSSWRRRIGFVLQDSPIFNATVRQNIVLDRGPVDPARFEETCLRAGVSSFAHELPGGLETVLGERGSQISGGQRQRIALARALYRDPWLLVLDEATNSLDAATEDLVLDHLATLKGQVTILLVTHGTQALRLADRIYEMAGGRVTNVAPGVPRTGS